MTGRFHVIGVAGVGMSALAEALLDAGCTVSGSDRLADGGDSSDVLQKLREQGLTLCLQDGSGVTAGVDAVVVSTAIEPDNPDLVRARGLGIPSQHRSELLKQVVAGRRLLTVAGTCGKSTVTAMLGWILDVAGHDPRVVNGAAAVNWQSPLRTGSTRAGQGAWAVIEADESDRSLLTFAPEAAIITNRSADHFPLAETKTLFSQFRARVSGPVIDGDALEAPRISARPGGWGCTFEIDGVRFEIPSPGQHNGLNAWLAARMAEALGVPLAASAEALRTFKGVVRRLERVGLCRGAIVVDDYAHNPRKLEAAWQTLAARYSRVFGVWRPHGYGPLRSMMEELVVMWSSVLRPDDALWVLPVYDAGGTADRSVDSGMLVARLEGMGLQVACSDSLDAAEASLRAVAAPECALLLLGARDPGLPRLARRLASDG